MKANEGRADIQNNDIYHIDIEDNGPINATQLTVKNVTLRIMALTQQSDNQHNGIQRNNKNCD